ncbi:hypothetical protein PR048_032040 [Dryococelus australis]|uniref:Uncharacterized protein n=1 Tax=Dryococelus australis TaxID=614101 RepID=A0ABQ9GB00_9NEOP|nr:hypothetical protein PR048_032040 [Dryococelus australis]
MAVLRYDSWTGQLSGHAVASTYTCCSIDVTSSVSPRRVMPIRLLHSSVSTRWCHLGGVILATTGIMGGVKPSPPPPYISQMLVKFTRKTLFLNSLPNLASLVVGAVVGECY